eukprot:gene19229-21156_t
MTHGFCSCEGEHFRELLLLLLRLASIGGKAILHAACYISGWQPTCIAEMVVKACPLCQQVLAVACKSCPSCGHIFQAKKSSSSKQSEKKPVTLTDSRLRSERNRKAATQQVANAKSSTKEDNTGLSGEISSNRAPKSAKSVTIDGEGNIKIKTNDNEACNKEAAGSQSGETLPIKKRGRPKGSKDKQKRLPKGYKQLKLVRNHDINAHAEWEIKESSDVSL